MGGLGTASAYAQAPTFSAPALPPIPGAPSTPSTIATTTIPGAPAVVSSAVVEVPPLENANNSPLSDLTRVSTPGTAASSTPAATINQGDALADLPPPVAAESGDVVAGAPSAPAATNVIPMLPPVDAESGDLVGGLAPPPLNGMALPLPPTAVPSQTATTASGQKVPTLAPPPFPSAPGMTTQPVAAATALADLDVDAPVRPAKSWKTKLKPVSSAYDTNYNYRRVLMPGAIYRTSYDRANQHLPTLITREDYVHMLFENAATNNIDGTRALLNAGTDINATNPRGETALQVARRYGAMDTASLLAARGAR